METTNHFKFNIVEIANKIEGQKVNAQYKGIVIRNGKKVVK